MFIRFSLFDSRSSVCVACDENKDGRDPFLRSFVSSCPEEGGASPSHRRHRPAKPWTQNSLQEVPSWGSRAPMGQLCLGCAVSARCLPMALREAWDRAQGRALWRLAVPRLT